jgi:HlyD family secretion protein
MKKRLPVVILLIVAVAGGVYWWRNSNSEPSDRIQLSGNIEMTEVDVAFKTAGRLVERTVTEGDRVRKGQVVARLDREQLLNQREAAAAAVETAKAQLTQAQTAARYQREATSADVEVRNADLDASQAKLRELKTGARPEEIREARAAVSAADAELERARNDWQRAQRLYKDDDISTAQHDQARARFEASQAQAQQTRERLRLIETGPRSEVIDAQASMVERAKAGVRVAQASALEVQRREQEIAARRAEVERAGAQLALIETQLEDTIAHAPASGVVLMKSADPGEVLAPGTSVLTIGDLEHPWVRGYINERDLGRVRIGSPVKVTTDAHPGKVYKGRLTFISSEAEFTPKQIQTTEERVKLVYRVKIEVENPNGELKSNMPVDAEIVREM